MPVKIKPELQALRAAAKAPRDGYFSVLDELIGQLPDRPISVAELRQRLKPGRILQREDMQFPLKQEEIQYALDPSMKHIEESLKIRGTDKISPKELLDRVRGDRPAFTVDDVHNEGEYSRYTTHGPDRVGHYNDGEDYFATTTDSPDFGTHKGGHYNDGTISFSRGSRHELPQGGGVLRVIDEMQNDRANAARQSRSLLPGEHPGQFTEEGQKRLKPARGWAAPGGDVPTIVEVRPGRFELHDPFGNAVTTYDDAGTGIVAFMNRARAQQAVDNFRKNPHIGFEERVPDAPFKTPQEYGRLEIKNQILDAIAAGDSAVGITPSSGPASWFPGTGAKDTTYDKVYPGELRKIAQQYGAPFEDVPVRVSVPDSLNLPTLQGTDFPDFRNTQGERSPMDAFDQYRLVAHDLDAGNHIGSRASDRLYEMQHEVEAAMKNHADGELSEQEMLGVLDDYANMIEDLYENASASKFGAQGEAIRKTPSMHLPLSVQERIARIGFSLFTPLAGAAMLSPEMAQESDMGVLDQPQGFAKGGMVGRATGALRGIREASERAAAGRGQERDWLRELALESEPRKPAGEPAHGAAGEYGAWAEGPAKAPQSRPQNFVERLPATRGTSERPVHPLRSRASDAQSLAKGYTSFADAMEMSPRRRQYFVDANKLKALNDNYGFSVGDRLIELQNQLLRDELAALDPNVGAIMARGPGDEVFLAGNDDELMRRAIERANDRLLTEGVHMETPQGKRTISGVASLKYGAGDDLEAAERDLMARKAAGKYDRGDASEAIEVLEAPRYKAQGGSLRTMRDHLNNYAAGGGVSMAERYADAIEGEYEDGDEFLDEDDQYEYYASGGQVHGYLFGGLKKIGKKLGKVVKKVAKVGQFVAPILGKIPGIGTIGGGLIGGLSGLIADGNLKGALSGALSGASGGLSNGLMKGALTVGSSMLDSKKKPKGIAGQMLQGVHGVQGQAPASIGPIPDMLELQQGAVATNAAAPTQLAMLQQSQQAQPRVQPGSNANGLLARIQQQQQQQPVNWQQLQPIQQPIG